MPNDSADGQRPLPERPNLRHLRDQAKDLLRDGGAKSLTHAQYKLAKSYGFTSWSKLRAHVASLHEAGQLKAAIDANHLEQVKALMTRNAALHHARMGYAGNGPLTWVAECRVPWEPPSKTRLAIAEWMIRNGSDVHQGGDGPLMRAALRGERIPMMELLVAHGADVNALWNGNFPILFAPCESVNPAAIQWLLQNGADPNCARSGGGDTALDYLIQSYERSPKLPACIDLLREAGGTSRYDKLPGVLDTIQSRVGQLAALIDADPDLVNRRFPDLDCGTSGARRLTLQGATLLHVAAEYGSLEAAKLLLARGAHVDARASTDDAGVGGQTPIFHCVTQFDDRGFAMTQLLLHAGADLSLRAKIPGHYDDQTDFVDGTALGYALRFPGVEFPGANDKTISLLREHGGIE